MKFMHISDLHIGKRVNEFSMLEDQRYILGQILSIADREAVEGIWIAGDIYDKSVPSAEAVGLFDDFLTGISSRNIPCFIISGNHDSPERIAFGARLMEHAGVYLSPVFHGEIEPVVLCDEFGEIRIYLLPFVKPAHVRAAYPEAQIESYQDALAEVIGRICAKESSFGADGAKENASQPESFAGGRESAKHIPWDSSLRNVLVAHQYVTGAALCDSEELSVGGLDQVALELFAPFDYVALGHIHTPQHVGGKENVRYCGTPLKYSFSEAGTPKSVTIVELREKGNTLIREVPLKPLHDVRKIRGTYMELTDRRTYQGTPVKDYLQVTLTDEEDVPGALGKLRTVYPNIMKLEYDNQRTRGNYAVNAAEDPENRSPLELFEELYELQNNSPMSAEQCAFMEQMIETVWEE